MTKYFLCLYDVIRDFGGEKVKLGFWLDKEIKLALQDHSLTYLIFDVGSVANSATLLYFSLIIVLTHGLNIGILSFKYADTLLLRRLSNHYFKPSMVVHVCFLPSIQNYINHAVINLCWIEINDENFYFSILYSFIPFVF